MLQPLKCYEGANGSLRRSEEDAVSDIIAAAGWGTASVAISGGNNDIEVCRLRSAILRAAEWIKKQDPKTSHRR